MKKRKRVGKTPEGRVKDDVNALLDHLGAFPFMPVVSFRGKRAVDYLVCWQGRYVAIETKAPGITKATGAQEQFLADVRTAGGWGFVVDSIESLAQQWYDACLLSLIQPPAIFYMSVERLKETLGIPLPKPLKDDSSSYARISESPLDCPICSGSTLQASPSPRRSKSSATTGRAGSSRSRPKS